MDVLIQRPVEIALRTLDAKEKQRVFAAFDRLRNWDKDEIVRRNSHKLDEFEDVYVLKATGDMRLFFKLQGKQITVLDIAKKSTIVSSELDAE
jgi:hypothetical protein